MDNNCNCGAVKINEAAHDPKCLYLTRATDLEDEVIWWKCQAESFEKNSKYWQQEYEYAKAEAEMWKRKAR